MRSETFAFHGHEMDDGRIYLTSPDLHGFRLMVSADDHMERELTSALRVFYPLYVASKAKAEACQCEPRLRKVERSKGAVELSADIMSLPPDPIGVMISSGVNKLLAAGMVLRYRSISGSSYYLGWPGRKGVLRISDHANVGRELDDAIYARLTIHRAFPPKETNFERHLAQALGFYLMKAPVDD